MLKSVYDVTDSGTVDTAKNALKVNNHTVLTDVPANALFTDTIYDDTNIVNSLNNKVDKITGKGLSTNDFTTTLKDKLDGIENNANNYTLPKSTSSTLGGVTIGNNLTINDGTLSLTSTNIVDALGYTPASSVSDTALYLKPPQDAGFNSDQYGNLKHKRTNTDDNWQWQSNDGTAKAQYFWETGRIKTTHSFMIPNSNASGYGLVNANGSSIIQDYNNKNVVVNATGGGLYLGYQNTTSINILNGKATIDANGNYSGKASNVTQKKSLSSVSNSGWGTNNGYVPDMSFIAYWNGAYSGTSSNLTYAHQGTIQCKPTNLYKNTSGTTGTITLSQTSANFSYLNIYYKNVNGEGYGSVKVYAPDGKKIDIANVESNSTLYVKMATMQCNGTTLKFNSNHEWYYGGSINHNNGNYIYVVRVDGVK